MLSRSCHDCRNGPLFSHHFPDGRCLRLLARVDIAGFTLSTRWGCPDWGSPISQGTPDKKPSAGRES